QTPAQALDMDARAYAELAGVSLATARSQIAAQHAADAAFGRLQQRLPRSFAGGFIQHAPSFHAIALFKGAVPPQASDLAGGAVELRGGATWTLGSLDTQSHRVFADVTARFDATAASSYDVETGAIDVSIQIPTELLGSSDAQLRALLPRS